jgi:hypothetical protein
VGENAAPAEDQEDDPDERAADAEQTRPNAWRRHLAFDL